MNSSSENKSSEEGLDPSASFSEEGMDEATRAFANRIEQIWVPMESARQRKQTTLRKIGRYEILAQLGRGGFGIVYLALDPTTQSEVALKIPILGSLEDSRNKERFLTEARAAASLQHRYIMPVLEAGEIDGIGYLSMRYCPLGTLATWLSQQSSPMQPRAAAALLKTLCEGVGVAHAESIVHRDLKPANILLDSSPTDSPLREFGIPFIPLVADFGMAKILGWDDPVVQKEQLTRTGTRMGTPCYMPPEHATGRAKESRPSADVYALGVILYELLAGQPPFIGESDYEVLHQVVSGEPASIRKLRPEVPRALEFICHRCLEKEPQRRYANANQLGEDLSRFLDGKRLANQPWIKRSTIKSLGIAVGLCCMVLFFGFIMRANSFPDIKSLLSSPVQIERDVSTTGSLVDYAMAIEKALPSLTGSVDESARRWLDDPKFTNAYSESLGFEWRFARQSNRNDHVLTSHSGESWAIAVSPDGKWMAENSNESHINLWDAHAESLIKRLRGHRLQIYSLAFSPNSRWLAASEQHHNIDPDGVIRSVQVWDLNHVIPMWQNGLNTDLSQLAGLVFSADNQSLYLYGCDMENRASIWKCDVGTAKVAWKWSSSPGMIQAVAESGREGGLWICQSLKSGDGARVSVLSLLPSTMEVTELLPEFTAPLGFATFSSDGSHLVMGESDAVQTDKIIRLNVIDIRSRRTFGPLEERGGCLEAFCFERETDNFFVVCASSREANAIRVLRKWDAKREQFSWVRTLSPGEMTDTMAMSPSSETLVLRRHKDPHIYFLELDRRGKRDLEGHYPKEAWSLAFSEDGQKILSGGDDGLARVWDVKSGKMLDEFDEHDPQLVTAVGFVPGLPNRVASGGFDNTIKLWSMLSGERSTVNLPHEASVRKLAFTPDGSRVFTIADDFFVRSWDVATGWLHWQSPTGIRKLKDLFPNPNGGDVAVAGNDGILRIFSMEDGTEKAKAESSSSEIWSVVYSPLEEAWLVGTNAGVIESFDGRGTRLSPWGVSNSGIGALTVSPDGKTLVSANMEGDVELWQIATKTRIGMLDRVKQSVHATVFSPDGNHLAAALHDGSIRMWIAEDDSFISMRPDETRR